ncbi:bifunctional diguanylate cyclase/phosphodiesterase [Shewanella sp. OMA3-2]|uniref:bifunctional diguanylate cyclase/phosphodiesterase n=1 Tax=Shewanella sp. OMA3-2 TaxID=2908650 RepID=UPI001F271BAE|nr:bifunctional diguanylate cyclase/phosphodiesterase [Shewanella sp. OMA3-2]UJF21109.1 EAL domain-containing protein [Shewanella sp. OMA3-2]
MKSIKGNNVSPHQFVLNDSLHQLFDAVNVVSVQGYDEQRQVIYWNVGSELLYGYTKEQALGQKLEDLIIPEHMRELVIAAHSNWITQGIEIPASEITLRHQNGTDVNVFSSHVLFTNQYNKKQMYCLDVNLADVKYAQSQAQFKDNMLKTIIEALPDLFFLMEMDGTILDYHGTDKKNIFVKPSQFIGKRMIDLLPEDIVSKFQTHIDKALHHHGMTTFEFELNMHRGIVYFEARLNYLSAYNQIVAIIRDISDQYKSAEIIRQQAYFDSLTQLPNRFLSLDRLSQMLVECERSNEKTAVLFLDLDDFKKINDSLGHEVGDKVLIESGRRLKQVLREADTVGRLGGDEFIVLLRGINERHDVLVITEHLLKAFRKPFIIDGRELMLTVSIGAAIYPENGQSASDLLRNADTAMYRAKDLGRNSCSFFSKEMNAMMLRRFKIEEQMHGALERKEFELYYQPQFDVKKRQITGGEALLRWHNSTLGNITPDEFIPIAEHTGLIVPIGRFVIQQALYFLNQWQSIKKQKYTMAVNLSPRQFSDIELLEIITKALIDNNINAESLELEITEGVLMSRQPLVHETLIQIDALGIKLSMDDFGTGYSSLSYLRQYDFDVLKIDRSFINGITLNKADCELVNAIISMAHSLGLMVVAEGVETVEQLTLLDELGCDLAQGYYFSKPIPAKAFLDFVADY